MHSNQKMSLFNAQSAIVENIFRLIWLVNSDCTIDFYTKKTIVTNCIVFLLFNLSQFANITNGDSRKFSVVSILNNPPCNVY